TLPASSDERSGLTLSQLGMPSMPPPPRNPPESESCERRSGSELSPKLWPQPELELKPELDRLLPCASDSSRLKLVRKVRVLLPGVDMTPGGSRGTVSDGDVVSSSRGVERKRRERRACTQFRSSVWSHSASWSC